VGRPVIDSFAGFVPRNHDFIRLSPPRLKVSRPSVIIYNI